MPPGPPPMMGGGGMGGGMMGMGMGMGQGGGMHSLPGPPSMAGGAMPSKPAAAGHGEEERADPDAGCTVRVDNVDCGLGDSDLRSLFQSQVRGRTGAAMNELRIES
jgi:membrane protease subunit (stomatin/prohibitin family)